MDLVSKVLGGKVIVGLEWLILGFVALVAWLVIFLLAYSKRRSHSVGVSGLSVGTQSVSAQLTEADRLLAVGQISQAEYEAVRSRILGTAPPELR
jgi:hypothetical protein